jgi:hypothetical protein
MRTNLVVAGTLLMAVVAPVGAQPVAGNYEVKYEEMSTNCDPVRFTYTRGNVRIDTGKSSLRVNIDTIPQMNGVPAKSGKISAKTPKKAPSTVDGIDGKWAVSGRVDDSSVLELVLVAELFRHDTGKPLCTQSWNLRGVRQADAKQEPPKPATPPNPPKKKAAFELPPLVFSDR